MEKVLTVHMDPVGYHTSFGTCSHGYATLPFCSISRQDKQKKIFVGSMDRESSQELQMWFSGHFFGPKLAA